MPSPRDLASCAEDLILVPAPGVGLLAMTREELRAGLARGREWRMAAGALTESPDGAGKRESEQETLVDAEGIAAITNVPASWFATAATRGEVPHYRFGRWVRFKPSEVLGSDKFVKHIGKEHPRAVEKLPASRHELRLMKGKKV